MNASELKVLRTDARLSQLDLERLTGIGRTYISLYENGRVAISEKHEQQLMNVFENVVLEDDDTDDELYEHVSILEYRDLKESIRDKLEFAPPGLLWGIDEEAREVVAQQVLSHVLHMLILLEEGVGEEPFLSSNNPNESVGEILYNRIR